MGVLFSIIVPVFNVEKYIDACIESLLIQPYGNFEIILVDDGSPDNCPEICDQYRMKDHRIKVIHKKNGGLSDARNEGLKIASGEYILFVDSDDMIEKDSLSGVAKAIENNNRPDVVFLEAKKIYPDGTSEPMGDGYDIRRINGKSHTDVLKFIETMPKFPGSACTKAIKRTLFNKGLTFQIGLISEDNEWSIRLFEKAQTYAYCEEPYYLYRQQREGSISHKTSERAINSLIAIIDKHSYVNPKSEYEQFCNAVCSYILLVLIYNLGEAEFIDDKTYIKVNSLVWVFRYSKSRKTRITSLAVRMIGIKATAMLLKIYGKEKK